ncbi:hypothetical protein ACMA5I_03940 [Paracoccaceae bacterium GXU_MW_L88]
MKTIKALTPLFALVALAACETPAPTQSIAEMDLTDEQTTAISCTEMLRATYDVGEKLGVPGPEPRDEYLGPQDQAMMRIAGDLDEETLMAARRSAYYAAYPMLETMLTVEKESGAAAAEATPEGEGMGKLLDDCTPYYQRSLLAAM